jgi:hypothetical protein
MTDENTTEAPASEMAKKLAPEEVVALTQMHRQAQETVQQIGQSEVRKARLLASLSEVEERAQGIMNAAAARLGIEPGTPWQMAPDGTVVILPRQPQAAQTH